MKNSKYTMSKKIMICKKCSAPVLGRGPDMMRHLKQECRMTRPKTHDNAPLGIVKHAPSSNGKFDPVHLCDQIRKINVSEVQRELDGLNERRDALQGLLRAAKAMAE